MRNNLYTTTTTTSCPLPSEFSVVETRSFSFSLLAVITYKELPSSSSIHPETDGDWTLDTSLMELSHVGTSYDWWPMLVARLSDGELFFFFTPVTTAVADWKLT